MFVNCSQNGQLAWTVPKSMHISKIHSLSMGGARSRLLVHIASPTSPPYVGTQLTALFRTQLLLKCLVYSIAAPNGKLRILVKAQTCTLSTWPLSLGLAYGRETWLYPTNTLSATVAFLLLPDTNLLPQAGITHYSHAATRLDSTLLNSFLCCFKSISSKF